ncbi:MAG: hypothetical protein ACRDJM_06025, partial [Actinomycetota bacterium]
MANVALRRPWRFGWFRRRALDGRISDAGRRIRGTLDADTVIRSALRELRKAVPDAEVAFWTPSEKGELRDPISGASSAPPLALAAARRRRSKWAEGAGAVPVCGPRGDLLAVVWVLGPVDPGGRGFVEDLAVEIGLALQMAGLYARAIAEKERSEAVLAHVGEAVVVTDASGRILRWNKGAEQTMERAAHDAVGRPCAEI